MNEEDKELAAMAAIAKAMEGIPIEDQGTRSRILNWAIARFGAGKAVSASAAIGSAASNAANDSPPPPEEMLYQPSSLADLYHAVDPDTEADRALIAGYWLGGGSSRNEFTGFDANKELKNLGHPIGNITDAFQSLIDRRPALVMQTAKSGSSRQARKKYKLTQAGVTAIKDELKK